MKDGKNFERINKIIQTAFKTRSDTIIKTNYKILNKSGREREIDILIETTVNNFNIKIAIECKDYNRRVSVEKVEAFHGKCQRIEGLSKKVMIASKGFQKDAINAAKDFEIDIYELKDITDETILSWIDTRVIKQLFTTMKLGSSTIIVEGEESDREFLPELHDNIIVHFVIEKDPMPLLHLVIEKVNEEKRKIHAYMISEYSLNREKELPMKEIIPIRIDLEGVFVEGTDSRRIFVRQIDSSIEANLHARDSDIEEIRRYENIITKKKEAEIISINTDTSSKLEIVNKTDTGETLYYYSKSDGTSKELKTIAIYDPIEDKWNFREAKL